MTREKFDYLFSLGLAAIIITAIVTIALSLINIAHEMHKMNAYTENYKELCE